MRFRQERKPLKHKSLILLSQSSRLSSPPPTGAVRNSFSAFFSKSSTTNTSSAHTNASQQRSPSPLGRRRSRRRGFHTSLRYIRSSKVSPSQSTVSISCRGERSSPRRRTSLDRTSPTTTLGSFPSSSTNGVSVPDSPTLGSLVLLRLFPLPQPLEPSAGLNGPSQCDIPLPPSPRQGLAFPPEWTPTPSPSLDHLRNADPSTLTATSTVSVPQDNSDPKQSISVSSSLASVYSTDSVKGNDEQLDFDFPHNSLLFPALFYNERELNPDSNPLGELDYEGIKGGASRSPKLLAVMNNAQALTGELSKKKSVRAVAAVSADAVEREKPLPSTPLQPNSQLCGASISQWDSLVRSVPSTYLALSSNSPEKALPEQPISSIPQNSEDRRHPSIVNSSALELRSFTSGTIIIPPIPATDQSTQAVAPSTSASRSSKVDGTYPVPRSAPATTTSFPSLILPCHPPLETTPSPSSSRFHIGPAPVSPQRLKNRPLPPQRPIPPIPSSSPPVSPTTSTLPSTKSLLSRVQRDLDLPSLASIEQSIGGERNSAARIARKAPSMQELRSKNGVIGHRVQDKYYQLTTHDLSSPSIPSSMPSRPVRNPMRVSPLNHDNGSRTDMLSPESSPWTRSRSHTISVGEGSESTAAKGCDHQKAASDPSSDSASPHKSRLMPPLLKSIQGWIKRKESSGSLGSHFNFGTSAAKDGGKKPKQPPKPITIIRVEEDYSNYDLIQDYFDDPFAKNDIASRPATPREPSLLTPHELPYLQFSSSKTSVPGSPKPFHLPLRLASGSHFPPSPAMSETSSFSLAPTLVNSSPCAEPWIEDMPRSLGSLGVTSSVPSNLKSRISGVDSSSMKQGGFTQYV